ncbi:LYR motif-containing protein 2 [Pseudolycoriella hygida]|uniref:LYR motif-containing protein 2 n=1 Tax=Pseudolycoriella hygida TaxID=35572 RepID=A0A9Q0NGF7_9DIPT|nr:LYR motif-containing protein 2 [Pseudolycoriella hygida]
MTKPTLNLKQFLLRQEVLKLYRDIFRTIRDVPEESSRKELREWTRHDFRNNIHHTEEITIKMLLNHGKRSLSELRTSLELSGVKK